MPILTTLGTVPVLAALIFTGFIAASSAVPQPVDFWAMGGAFAGSLWAIMEGRGKALGIGRTFAMFLVSWCVGVFGPAIAYALARHFGVISDALDARITWHWWAAAGLLWSMKGLLIAKVTIKWGLAWAEKRRCRRCAFPPLRQGSKRPPHQ